jgi:L-alanine-DL-glutamate epimerase-like enolase superfamily enzyme
MSPPARQPSIGQVACRVVSASVSFHPQKLVTPLVLSTGTIEELIEARATVTIETVAGKRAEGRGSIYLSDLWAWPDLQYSHERRVHELLALTSKIATGCGEIAFGETLHPLELGLRLHHWAVKELAAEIPMPAMARAMCASPFDAAIHDATGIALGRSSFDLFDENVPIPSADDYFPHGGVIEAICRVIRPMRKNLSAWLVVSKSDLLPEMISNAYAKSGYRCFKLKITGRDNYEDVRLTIDVHRAAQCIGVEKPTIVIDSNEANPDAASVLDYLERLESLDCEAYRALAYIEQPTARDIANAPFDWRPVAERKPVLLDEGLSDLSVLAVARQQGWSGFALKTCKGHSMLLVAAAWAHSHRMQLSLQDLTNPGLALIHSALVGAHLPTLNGAELNSPQFTSAANEDFIPRLGSLFTPRNGLHYLPVNVPDGLGSVL